MADFEKAFELVIKNEGGYVNDPDDPGGETYKGVARNRNPAWSGWINVDLLKQGRGFPANCEADTALQTAVKELYQVNYWHKVRGDQIDSQAIAQSVFDFGVNAGPITSAKLAQYVCGAKSDGVIGKKTLVKLNEMNEALFLSQFALAKLARYVNICKRNPTSRKYFYGWSKRILEAV
jgi:lysozyme family protein